jgi:hypothetical protein
MLEIDTLIEFLVEKGVVTKHEVLAKLKRLGREIKAKREKSRFQDELNDSASPLIMQYFYRKSSWLTLL